MGKEIKFKFASELANELMSIVNAYGDAPVVIAYNEDTSEATHDEVECGGLVMEPVECAAAIGITDMDTNESEPVILVSATSYDEVKELLDQYIV